jgi:hypothetical protein
MSRIPLLGSQQVDVRYDGAPPRVRTRSLWCWRAWDGLLAPLNPGLSVAYRGRSSTATIYASDGTSGSLTASAPAFTAIDWDGDGAREEDGLLLSSAEALRYYDASTNRLRWTMGAKVIRLDGIESGNAMVEDAPFWSFTTDAIAGAYLAVLGTGDLGAGVGGIALHHYNGTSTVVSQLPLAAGDRFSLRAQYFDDGAVQIGLVRNGGREATGTKSAALEPESSWGDGGATQIRVNEIGDDSRGTSLLRYGAVYGGVATRQQLLEVL